jgi:hypothetical protein
MMKIINKLSGLEIAGDDMQSIYTGPEKSFSRDRHYPASEFEKDLPDRIFTKDLVLHELNLLHTGYDFWAKIDYGDTEGANWVPVRIEK